MTTAKVSTKVQDLAAEAVPTTPTVTSLPEVVELNGPYINVLHKMTALVRNGYVLDSVTSFGPAWPLSMTLRLGNPDQTYIDAAIVDVAEARALEQHRRQCEIEDAARRLVDERAKVARQAELDAQIATQKATLAALEAAAAAA